MAHEQQVRDEEERFWCEIASLDEILEALADQLLVDSLDESPSEEYPFFSERKLRRLLEQDGDYPEAELEEPPPGTSPVRRCAHLLRAARLPLRQRMAAWLLLQGRDRAEIADLLGVSPSSIGRWCEQLADHLNSSAVAGMAALTFEESAREVYREEVSRHNYRPERHCSPGHEACRERGLCTRRWYLHYLSGGE